MSSNDINLCLRAIDHESFVNEKKFDISIITVVVAIILISENRNIIIKYSDGSDQFTQSTQYADFIYFS